MKRECLPKNQLASSVQHLPSISDVNKPKGSAFEDINIDENELVLMTEDLKEPEASHLKKRKGPKLAKNESQALYSEIVLRTEDS